MYVGRSTWKLRCLPAIAFLHVCSGKIAAVYFSPKGAELIVGLAMACCCVGTMLAMATTAMFADFRSAFWVSFILLAALAIAWLAFVREDKSQTGTKTTVEAEVTAEAEFSAGALANITSDLKKVFKSRAIWFACVIVGIALVTNTAMTGFLPAAFCAFITGLGVGGTMATTLGIAPSSERLVLYAGTANGLIVMVEMLFSTVVPTYLIVPLTSGNYTLLFTVTGLCSVVSVILALAFPRKY